MAAEDLEAYASYGTPFPVSPGEVTLPAWQEGGPALFAEDFLPLTPALVQAVVRRVDELRRLAQDPATTPGAFAYVVTRAVRTIARGSGNELLNDVISDLANQTVWTTIWKSPLDYLTQASRRRTAQRMADVLDAIERGASEDAERLLRDLLEQDRDQAIRQLARMRGETCDPHRTLRTINA